LAVNRFDKGIIKSPVFPVSPVVRSFETPSVLAPQNNRRKCASNKTLDSKIKPLRALRAFAVNFFTACQPALPGASTGFSHKSTVADHAGLAPRYSDSIL
jgi:hypothetical protein